MPSRFHAFRTPSVVIAGAALVLAACQGPGTSPAAADEPNELLVLEWSGYDAEDFWTDFQAANPETVVDFELADTDVAILAQMEGGSEADVFHFYTGYQQFYVDAGLVQEIDTSLLTNWDKVPEDLKVLGQVDGKQYYIPWDWGFTSILYNTEEIPEGVTSWDALFNEEYAGHISMWNDGPGAVTVSSYIHGYDENELTDEQLAEIEEEWKAQKPLNAFYWSSETELCPAVIDGTVWVAYAWQGCYATALYEGAPVAYANPDEGRNSWVGLYGISADSDSPQLAHEFLDMKLAELTCSNAVTLFYYGCANSDVMAAIEDPVLIEAFGVNDPSILEETNFTPPVTAEQRSAWTSMWERVQAE